MSLTWREYTMRFVAGLNQKTDAYSLEAPELARLRDAQFDKIGALSTRYPYAALSNDIFGGGTLSDIRRIVPNGNELLCFTKDALYSWNAQLSSWVLKGTYLAAAVDERTVFVTTGDQYDCDRAELDGTIVYTWMETVGTTSTGYVAAIDKTTYNVLMAPTALPGSAARLRLTALATKILLTFYDGVNGLYAYALDPASPATALAGASSTITNTNFGEYYDIVRTADPTTAVWACRRNPTTSYDVGAVTEGLITAKVTKARTCDGPIAMSVSPSGFQIVRANGANIQGDFLDGTLADVYTAQAIGTVPAGAPVNNIAAAHRSVQNGGEYRCYVTWSYRDGYGGFFDAGSKSNWVDTGGTLGTQADFVDRLGIASRSFDHDGHVFTWLVFAEVSESTTNAGANPVTTFGALQNVYFLYRDDGLLCGKAAVNVAGASWNASVGFLPGVQLTDTNTYKWCGVESRIVVVGLASAYSDRGPRDIAVEFDANRARRCERLGETLYIAGAEVMQYDGVRLVELGFHTYPWQIDLTSFGPSTLPAATLGYKMSWRYDNARGERERSTTATEGTVDRPVNTYIRMQPLCQLNVTHKTTPAVAAEAWRTVADPPDGAPYYLVTDPNPTVVTGDNYYFANDTSAMIFGGNNDKITDADLIGKESHPENGSVLENLAPPPASIIAATDTRLFLAGVSGDPDRVWYSKQRSAGELAAFHESLTAQVPPAGGSITALAFLNNMLVVFRERAIYLLPGDGFDNAGGGQNYGPAHVVSTDVGAASQEAICVTDAGVFLHSSKGKWLLSKGWQLEYIGAPVTNYDSEDVLAVHAVESKHEIRWVTNSRVLVLNTLAKQWSEWSINDALHACLWNGVHHYTNETTVKAEQTTYTGLTYGMDVETAWIKLADLQGYGAVDFFDILGEFRSACTVRVLLARDYVPEYFQDKTHTPALTAGYPLQLRHHPSIKQVKALKVRITITPTSGGEGVKLVGLAFKLGMRPGLNRNVAQGAKQ